MALSQSSILVPLYIYPLTPETWEPLYQAIQSFTHLHFTVILNPDSGPGTSPAPDRSYVREIARLNSYPNVTTIGYVRIDYCKRGIEKVKREIGFYSAWAGLDSEGKEDENVKGCYDEQREEGTSREDAAQGVVARNGEKNGFLKPSVKAKPWHLKSLFRSRSPFRYGNHSQSDPSTSPSPTTTPPRTASSPAENSPRNPPTNRSSNLSPAQKATNSNSVLSSEPNSPPESNANSNSAPPPTTQATSATNANANANAATPTGRRPLQVQGIFFDETPNLYSPSNFSYLGSINRVVKHARGIGGTKLILHNPGTMPDAELVGVETSNERRTALVMDRGSDTSFRQEQNGYVVPDVTAIFEASYAEYMSPSAWTMSQHAKCKVERERAAVLVHSVPVESVVDLTRQLRSEAAHVFVTDLTEGFYCAFDRSWHVFVKAMAEAAM